MAFLALCFLADCASNVFGVGEIEANLAAILLYNSQTQSSRIQRDTPLNIFETSTLYNVPGQITSIATADQICQSDANNPRSGVVYKAMIVRSGFRLASVTPDAGDGQIDWVFQPNRRYVRLSDQQTVQVSNGVGLLPFPLQNPINPTNFFPLWTGMNVNWQTSLNCANWASAVGSANAGDIRLTSNAMLFSSNATCGGGGLLVCVEQ